MGIVGGGACWDYANGKKIYVYEKKIDPRGLSVPDHNIQKISLKPLGQSKPNFMWSFGRKRE